MVIEKSEFYPIFHGILFSMDFLLGGGGGGGGTVPQLPPSHKPMPVTILHNASNRSSSSIFIWQFEYCIWGGGGLNLSLYDTISVSNTEILSVVMFYVCLSLYHVQIYFLSLGTKSHRLIRFVYVVVLVTITC